MGTVLVQDGTMAVDHSIRTRYRSRRCPKLGEAASVILSGVPGDVNHDDKAWCRWCWSYGLDLMLVTLVRRMPLVFVIGKGLGDGDEIVYHKTACC